MVMIKFKRDKLGHDVKDKRKIKLGYDEKIRKKIMIENKKGFTFQR